MAARVRRTRVGDVVVVTGHHVGEPERVGEILEILGDADQRRYRVRWDNGHETTFYPGSDASVRHRNAAGEKKP